MNEEYEQTLTRFQSARDHLQQQGVMEQDLPFLMAAPQNAIGILMLHGSAATPCNCRELGQKLFDLGHTVMGTLLSGHGMGPGVLENGLVGWRDCLHSAVESLSMLEKLVDKVYILGSSFGGTLAYIMGLQYPRRLAGVIALSAPTLRSSKSGPFSPWIEQLETAIGTVEDGIQDLNIPILVMHSADDKSIKMKHAIYAFNTVEVPQKKMVLYNQVGHSLGFGFNTEEVSRDIHQFIVSYTPPVAVRFELESRGLESVHLVGDFNNWDVQAQTMYYSDGVWACEIQLSPGTYQYKFLLNRQKWILDPRQGQSTNAQGGYNSIIRVG